MPSPGIGRTVQIKDSGESRTMTRDELYMYQKIVGQEFKKYILSNYDVLDSLTKKQFETAVKREFRRIRDAVKARLTFGESFEDIMKPTN